MKRNILEKKFEETLVKTRPGSFGENLSYVEGAEYIKRLNEAFDGAWSFEIVEYTIHEHDVVVLGRLVAGDVTKSAFGGATIKGNLRTGETHGLADGLKAATTDALKKASTLLGLGLHLYSDLRKTSSPPLTPRQLKAIIAISRALGWRPDVLRQQALDHFGAPPDELNKSDASALIGELQQMSVKKAA